ncbi:hypothetical protein FRB95_011490 [Tulasnella sp. JGI-2019a]|nr:hypothetical protein FRB93_012921 [Tulasnella sp. JGI-2019a]KAG9035339.1 hypothetical protein FRB95_011490 [Tulasnella sp. JGI-2019a]
MENLINQIYFEHQDGALCAQHALNNLLQANYFTAPDLAALARNLDNLEIAFRSDEAAPRAGTSRNMDDSGESLRSRLSLLQRVADKGFLSGFFSIQVLDDALKVFGLK